MPVGVTRCQIVTGSDRSRYNEQYDERPVHLAQRGIVISYEPIRRWCAKFGPGYPAAVDPGVIPSKPARVENRFLLRRGGSWG